jgi:hypothetical protein
MPSDIDHIYYKTTQNIARNITSGAGTAYLSGTTEFNPVLVGFV